MKTGVKPPQNDHDDGPTKTSHLLSMKGFGHTGGTDRRRSERIPLSIPLDILSLDPFFVFRGRCRTVNVSCHGCRFISHRPFPHNARIRLITLPSFCINAAHVVLCIPVMPAPQVDTWHVGVELVAPGNFWGVKSPPLDWIRTA